MNKQYCLLQKIYAHNWKANVIIFYPWISHCPSPQLNDELIPLDRFKRSQSYVHNWRVNVVIINSWIFHCPQPTVEWQLNTTGRIKKKKKCWSGTSNVSMPPLSSLAEPPCSNPDPVVWTQFKYIPQGWMSWNPGLQCGSKRWRNSKVMGPSGKWLSHWGFWHQISCSKSALMSCYKTRPPHSWLSYMWLVLSCLCCLMMQPEGSH